MQTSESEQTHDKYKEYQIYELSDQVIQRIKKKWAWATAIVVFLGVSLATSVSHNVINAQTAPVITSLKAKESEYKNVLTNANSVLNNIEKIKDKSDAALKTIKKNKTEIEVYRIQLKTFKAQYDQDIKILQQKIADLEKQLAAKDKPFLDNIDQKTEMQDVSNEQMSFGIVVFGDTYIQKAVEINHLFDRHGYKIDNIVKRGQGAVDIDKPVVYFSKNGILELNKVKTILQKIEGLEPEYQQKTHDNLISDIVVTFQSINTK